MLKKFLALIKTTEESIMTEFTQIKTEKTASIGEITLNTPETLNIIEKETFQEINKALTIFENDKEVKIILFNAVCGISKKGKKVFSAGVNLKKYDEKFELAKTAPEKLKEELKKARALMTRIEKFDKPVIIGINGLVTGGFFEFALCCDVILMSNSATLCFTEANIGLIPGYGGIHRLLRIVGKNRAFEIISAAKPLNAQESLNLGIAAKIFDDNEFETQTAEYCKNLATKPSSSICLIKKTLCELLNCKQKTVEEIEIKNFISAVSSEEAKKGIRKFFDKK